MTANQLNYQRNLEQERSNKEQEKLSRQRMMLDWYIAQMQNEMNQKRIDTDLAINSQQIQSKERMDYFNRQQNWETQTRNLNFVEVPKVDIQKEQVNVKKAEVAFGFANNLLNTAKSVLGFGRLFG